MNMLLKYLTLFGRKRATRELQPWDEWDTECVTATASPSDITVNLAEIMFSSYESTDETVTATASTGDITIDLITI